MPDAPAAPNNPEPAAGDRSGLLEGQEGFISEEATSPPPVERTPPTPPSVDPEPAADAPPVPVEEIVEPTPAPADPAADAPAAPVEEPAEPLDPFMQMLADAGFTDVESEEDGRARLSEYIQQRQQADQELEQLRAQTAYYQQQQAAQYQQQPAQPAPEPEPAAEIPRIFPEINFDQMQKFRTEEGGWAPNTPPELIAQGEDFFERQQQFLYNPDAVLAPIIDARARAIAEEIVRSGITEHAEAAEVDQFISTFQAENPWIYKRDPVTNDLLVGEWTDEGRRLQEIATGLSRDKVPFEKAWQMAKVQYDAEQITRQGRAAGPDTASLAEQKRQEFLAANAATPAPPADRSGTLPLNSNPEPQRPQDDRNAGKGRRVVELMQADGAL